MPDMLTFDISSATQQRVGLIVRGKFGPNHHPGKLDQHADCILPNGAPMGFFGEGNDNSGNGIGLRMQGVVYDFARMEIERPYYVDRAKALAARVVSTVLLVGVDSAAAKLFKNAWEAMTKEPGDFNIIGGNCASHASAAFIHAKILGKQIPGLDTPDNLYKQLVGAVSADQCSTITGFIGFARRAGQTGFKLEVTPYVDAPTANRPNPGSSISG